ncbi:MAG: bacillithiol biosynthesis cysteine-adding enzyme BshC [candidate division Zixibacteria bacterium]|nr:bacillithiol biosynthesis cysteine-adding enzyme BshC [candidate division Zixibacteria bacterium]
MTSNLIAPAKSLGYTDIFLDFLAERDTARHFYLSSDIAQVASRLDAVTYARDEVATVLESQNRSFGASDLTLENISRLREGDTLCLFSGQQAGLFTGPLLVIIKAIGIIKAAARYSQQLGRPVIPVFWIAGDDHDFEEVNHTYVLDRAGEPVRIAYEKPPDLELPTSELRFVDGEALENAKKHLLETLPNTDFSCDLLKLIQCAYTAEDTFVSSFGKFMTGLLGQYGLVLFNPGDARIKRLAVPLFKSILDNYESLQQILAETNREILNRGYHVQVEKKENAAHLFYNHGGRRPVMRDGDRLSVGEESFTLPQIRELIEKHPERFSPDVMTRPILQSYLFPVVSQKGGPAEIAYLAQINPVFELFGLVPPVHRARPTATLLEKRIKTLMDEYDIEFEQLSGDIEQVINRVLARSFPGDIETRFAQLRQGVERSFGEFSRETLAFDPSLEGAARQSLGKIDFTLKAFEGKVFAAHKKRSGETRDRIYRVWHATFPHRALQERSLNITYFLAKYGFDLVRAMYDMIDCEQKAHQIIHLAELNK